MTRNRKGKAKDEPEPIVRHGWTIYPHPALLEQLDVLEAEVLKRGADSDPGKVFAWALDSIFDRIPSDPKAAYFRHGGMMGKDYTGWFRDKGFRGRFRLFFRYSADSKEIVVGWINDDESKRTRGSKNDAYAVFKKRLDEGNPPNDWAELLEEAKAPGLVARVMAKRRGREG